MDSALSFFRVMMVIINIVIVVAVWVLPAALGGNRRDRSILDVFECLAGCLLFTWMIWVLTLVVLIKTAS